jgi:hypothetical protein
MLRLAGVALNNWYAHAQQDASQNQRGTSSDQPLDRGLFVQTGHAFVIQ